MMSFIDTVMQGALETARSDYENMYLEKVPAEHNNDIDWIFGKIKDRKIEFGFQDRERVHNLEK